MTEEFKQAQEIANSLEEQIKIVDPDLTYPRILKLAIFTADRMKSVIPMYTGNLNPTWKKYDTVVDILKGRLNGG